MCSGAKPKVNCRPGGRELHARRHRGAAQAGRAAAHRGDDAGRRRRTLNVQLHAKIHEIAIRPKLLWFAERAHRMVPFGLWLSLAQLSEWWEFNRVAHTPIIDLIAGRDADGARAAMKDHFVVTGEMLLTKLDSIAFWDSRPDPHSYQRRDGRARAGRRSAPVMTTVVTPISTVVIRPIGHVAHDPTGRGSRAAAGRARTGWRKTARSGR